MRGLVCWLVCCWVLADAAVAGAQPSFTEMVPMRDGVRLATDVYLPDGIGPWPVVLVRTPYGRDMAQDAGAGLRDAGVATVAQDMRGRYDSEGTDCVWRCSGGGELRDGYDTLAWIEAAEWSDGHVVSHGGSANGIVQYLTAPTRPPGLSAMWVEVATPAVYDHLFFPGGCFRKHLIENWLAGQHSTFFLDDIAAHPLADAFWDPVQAAGDAGAVQVPAVHVGGWYDFFVQGTIDAFVSYQNLGDTGAAGAQKLILGPWGHGLYRRQVGGLTYPENAADIPGGIGDLLALWLLHYLGVEPDQAAVDAVPAVQYYVMGDVDDPGAPGNAWRAADTWPPEAAPIRMYFQPGGDLSEACPPAGGGASTFVYDPDDPSPTVGGANLYLSAGPRDQAAVEARGDVLVFSTPVLEQPVEITGPVRAHLWVSADVPDTDLVLRLTDVYPDGRSMLVLDRPLRLAARGGNHQLVPLVPGEVTQAVVDLWSTSIILAAGHRLRVIVSGSNCPRFRANPNDGTSYGDTAAPRPATVHLHHELEHPSCLEIPAPDRDPADVNLCATGPDGTDAGDHADGYDAGEDAVDDRDDGADRDAGPDPEGDTTGGCGCAGAVPSRERAGARSGGGHAGEAWYWIGLLGLFLLGRRAGPRRGMAVALLAVLAGPGACATAPREIAMQSDQLGHEEAIRAIARDIQALKAEFPQLADFSAARHCHPKNLSIGYAFHTHRSTRRGGWAAAVPNPDPDGVWFHIDFHDPASTAQIHTQPVVPPMHRGEKKVMFLILEGKATRNLAGELQAILERYGVRMGPG